jgi:hypothetical protein
MRMPSRTSATISAIALTAGLAVAVAAAARAATSTDLYVQNAPGIACSDTGTGTWEQPFCTIGAAAAIVQPGQTVHVEAGSYPIFAVTTSGTPDAPITFQADGFVHVGVTGGGGGPGVTISGVHDVRVNGFVIFASSAKQAVLINNAASITVNGGAAQGGAEQAAGQVPVPAIQVTGTSSNITISRVAVHGLGSGVRVDPGTLGVQITTNVVQSLSGRGRRG